MDNATFEKRRDIKKMEENKKACERWREKEEDRCCVVACLGITLDLTMRSAKLDFGLFVGKV